MDIKALTLVKDFAMTHELHTLLGNWLDKRGMNVDEINFLPNNGKIIYFQGKPIAAGFIRHVEGGFALIDGMLSDPESNDLVRSDCLDILTQSLMELAKQHQFTHVLAFTMNKRTIKRAQKFGFNKQKHTLVSMKLS